jgi:hypothetical protein
VLARLPALLNPLANPSWLETMSHKVLRLVSPFALIALFLSTATSLAPSAAPHKGLKQVLLAAQVLGYAAAAIGPRAGRVPGVARTFVMMHAAALVGLWRFLRGGSRSPGSWLPAGPSAPASWCLRRAPRGGVAIAPS